MIGVAEKNKGEELKNEENLSVTLRPDNLVIQLIYLAIGIIWARFLLEGQNAFATKFSLYFFLFKLAITFYFLYYILIYSKIFIFKDKIALPFTNYNGFPSAFIFKRKEIDIHSITRIIKYPLSYVSPRLAFHGAKISIISKIAGNIQLSYGFYGVERIENLILEISRRNENVQIIEQKSL